MGIVIRQSIFTTLISYAGAAIGYVNLLYLYPKFLSPDEIGLLRTIQDAAILFSPFAQFGLAYSILRFYPQLVKDKKSEGGFISLIMLLSVVGFGIFLIVFKIFETPILSYFNEKASALLAYSGIVLWLTFILLMTAILEAYSRSLLKTSFPNLVREIIVRLLMAALVTSYFLGWISYQGFIICTVLSYLFCLFLLMGYLAWEKNFTLSLDFSFLDRDKIKKLITYSLLSFAGAAGLVIVGKIDSLMVAAIAGLKSVAIYTTAFYMASVIEIPKRALTYVAMPLIARGFEKNDMAGIHEIYKKTALHQFIIGVLLLIGVYINLENIFQFMPRGEIYAAGKWVVIIIGIGKLTDMLFGPSSEIVILSRYYSFNIVLILLLAGMVIVANNLLIPVYGITGAAMGAALSLIIFNVVKYLFIYFKLGMQPFTLNLFKCMMVALFTLGLNYLLPTLSHPLVDMVVRSLLVATVFSSLVLWLKISPEGNQLFRRGIQMLKDFF